MDTVSPGSSANAQQDVTDAVGGSADQLGFPEQADAHRIHERVAGVSLGERDFAAQRRDPDAIAVVADASDYSREQVAVSRHIQGAKPEAVQHRHRTCAHGEYVAQNAADTGGGALVWLDRARVVVGLDLEGDRPSLGKPQHPGILAGTLDDLRAGGGERRSTGLECL